jgi:hypothetical protein
MPLYRVDRRSARSLSFRHPRRFLYCWDHLVLGIGVQCQGVHCVSRHYGHAPSRFWLSNDLSQDVYGMGAVGFTMMLSVLSMELNIVVELFRSIRLRRKKARTLPGPCPLA